MLKKVYVEITNICNLSCPFCHGTKRQPRIMSANEFAAVAEKLRGVTDYVYLHVLGEPLAHPELREILSLAASAGFNVCITTNGTLLKKRADLLMNADKLYKLSVSLHSFEANSPEADPTEYLDSVWSVCEALAARGTICSLRLWNGGGGSNRRNGAMIGHLCRRAGVSEPLPARKGMLIKENIYLELADEFEWPDLDAGEKSVEFCYGLRDQIGILSDGTVVPCCLDADGELALGNIFESELADILTGRRARSIYDGFSARRPNEELCRRCGYAARFSR